ncbi:hypothetical protein [Staphylococcus saprophyticus]|nr:hypothetical protein [Staphylococcus saprophyticus]
MGGYLEMGGGIGVLSVVEGCSDGEGGKDVGMEIGGMNGKYV